MGGHAAFVVPGSIDTKTGGYGYDRAVIAALRERAWTIDVVELPGRYPQPSPEDRGAAAQALALLPSGTPTIVDGLALGALPEQALGEAARLPIVALVHHPLADETGLPVAERDSLAASEQRALTAARHVIVTSRATGAGLSRYGVAPAAISVVEPGTDAAPQARGSGGPHVELLCVASLVPRKGHDLLLRALAPLVEMAWHLTCVGGLDHDPHWAETIRRLSGELGLDDRVALIGPLGRSELDRRYDRADLFVLPTWYEGYGMAVAEALARGLPVVSTATGAIGDLVGADAGRLVPPGDVAALTAALEPLLRDPALRSRLSAGAREAWGRMPSWTDAAVRIERVLEGVSDAVEQERRRADG